MRYALLFCGVVLGFIWMNVWLNRHEAASEHIVVQFSSFDGRRPVACWEVQGPVRLSKRGVTWKNAHGDEITVGGSYAVMAVKNHQWIEAAESLGVDEPSCKFGAYHQYIPTLPEPPKPLSL